MKSRLVIFLPWLLPTKLLLSITNAVFPVHMRYHVVMPDYSGTSGCISSHSTLPMNSQTIWSLRVRIKGSILHHLLFSRDKLLQKYVLLKMLL